MKAKHCNISPTCRSPFVTKTTLKSTIMATTSLKELRTRAGMTQQQMAVF
jgi:DNA-binding transcriptional regulator YiaG